MGFQWLKNLLWPRPQISIRFGCTFDFTKPDADHWAGYDCGDQYDAHFTIRTRWRLGVGDEILVCLRSGRIGRYHIFSCKPDFTGVADYKTVACAVKYEGTRSPRVAPTTVNPFKVVPFRMAALPAPRIKALLTDGSGSKRSCNSKLPDLPGCTTIAAGEHWKIFVRNEACRRRANKMRTTGNL